MTNRTSASSRELWALSRIGSRRLVYGPLDRVVPSAVAADWIDKLLALDLERGENAAYCLALLAQRTGDRARDVPDDVRDRVAAWLRPLPDADRFLGLLDNADADLDQAEQDWLLGDALPAGLVLAS